MDEILYHVKSSFANNLLLLWYCPGSLARRKVWDTAGYKRVSHAFEGMCVWEKEDDAFASRSCTLFSSNVACVELNTRAYLVQVSDQRGTCLVENPAKGDLCL